MKNHNMPRVLHMYMVSSIASASLKRPQELHRPSLDNAELARFEDIMLGERVMPSIQQCADLRHISQLYHAPGMDLITDS